MATFPKVLWPINDIIYTMNQFGRAINNGLK